jgi:hypothetical protein
MPVVGLEAWFTQIPPVTRTWLALSVLTSVAVVRVRSGSLSTCGILASNRIKWLTKTHPFPPSHMARSNVNW